MLAQSSNTLMDDALIFTIVYYEHDHINIVNVSYESCLHSRFDKMIITNPIEISHLLLFTHDLICLSITEVCGQAKSVKSSILLSFKFCAVSADSQRLIGIIRSCNFFVAVLKAQQMDDAFHNFTITLEKNKGKTYSNAC